MRECSVTYRQACALYDSMCRAFEDGVVEGSQIRIGRVGTLQPVWRPARAHHMHFVREKGGVVKTGIHRTYHLDGRYHFKFKLYRQFLNTKSLRWIVCREQDT